MVVLGEHTFPDRLRVRPVSFGTCDHGRAAYAAVVGAQLGGLDTGLDAVWRWCAFERLRPPFQEQLNGIREMCGDGYPRACLRRLVATFGVPWEEVSIDVAGWQVERLERLPAWLRARLYVDVEHAHALGYEDVQLDRLRRSLAFENVESMQSALAALQTYRLRALDQPAVLNVG
jgi:hypothetical protein